MRRAAAGLILAVVVAACFPPAGRLFQTTLMTPDGSYPLQVMLGDQTDLVVAVEPGAVDPEQFANIGATPSVRSNPADGNVLIISWVGGACEGESALSFWPEGDHFGLMVAHRGGPGLLGGCPAIGLFRAIRVRTVEPVATNLIRVIRNT